MKKILITGVAGFIGSNLANYLLKYKNYKIIGIDNLSYGKLSQVPKGVKFHKVDIRSKKICSYFKDVDVVFHLAAKNCISDCQSDPKDTFDINVHGSINVFQIARECNVRKIVFADSSAVYEGERKFPSKENKTNPISYYALSKQTTTDFLSKFADESNIDIIILRYFNVYGINQDYRRTIPPLMSAFIIKILQNKRPVIYGNGSKRRDFIHVDDINSFHKLIIQKKIKNKFEIYNLGSGINYSVNDILKIIKELMKSNIKPIFKNNLEGEAKITKADISKARKIGWKIKVNLKDGIWKMIKHAKENEIYK